MKNCKPCSIKAAIGFALDICEQENIKIESLEKIGIDGYESDEEVIKALNEFNNLVPENRKIEAKSIKCFLFSDSAECNII